MGGFRVATDELRKIKDLSERGVRYSIIARKLKRTPGFVAKYSRLIEEGKINVADEVIIPALLANPTPLRSTPAMNSSSAVPVILSSDSLTDEQKVIVLKALLL